MKGNRRNNTLHSPIEFIAYIVTEFKLKFRPHLFEKTGWQWSWFGWGSGFSHKKGGFD